MPVRALLLENPHTNADPALEALGLEIVRHTGALDEDELVESLADVTVLGIRSKTQVTERALAAAPQLLAIGAFCIGTNQIDLTAASRRGVAVFNAPFSNTRSVVELAIGEIIALNRRLTERDRALHEGVWNKSSAGAHEVRGKTLGIVGYGNIGTQLSVLAESLGMNVVFFDTAEKLALGNAQRLDSLEALLDTADVVTLHVDGRAGNAGMFGRSEFEHMRRGSIFLNLSRGFLVDYAALRDQLEAGHIAGAAVDVFPEEPKRNGDPFASELRGLSNVILTPHIGGSTEEAQVGIGRFVSHKLARYVNEGATTLSVNLPPLSLDRAAGARSRVTYLHRNTPGALALINQALAESGANIESQILGTKGELGYVVTDLGRPVSTDSLAALVEVPDAIRLRVI